MATDPRKAQHQCYWKWMDSKACAFASSPGRQRFDQHIANMCSSTTMITLSLAILWMQEMRQQLRSQIDCPKDSRMPA